MPNAATERWLADGAGVPVANRVINRLAAPTIRYTPTALQGRLIRAQRASSRLLTPQGPTDDGPATLLDAGPLYAGESVARIESVEPGAEIVALLTP